MSRGALLLRSVAASEELPYIPVAGTTLHKRRRLQLPRHQPASIQLLQTRHKTPPPVMGASSHHSSSRCVAAAVWQLECRRQAIVAHDRIAGAGKAFARQSIVALWSFDGPGERSMVNKDRKKTAKVGDVSDRKASQVKKDESGSRARRYLKAPIP